MSKLRNEFEENIDYFLQQSKNQHSKNVQKKDKRYGELLEKLHKFVDDLVKDKKDKFELEDEIFDCYYQLIYIEGMYLYKQGFKDCYKIIQLLRQD